MIRAFFHRIRVTVTGGIGAFLVAVSSLQGQITFSGGVTGTWSATLEGSSVSGTFAGTWTVVVNPNGTIQSATAQGTLGGDAGVGGSWSGTLGSDGTTFTGTWSPPGGSANPLNGTLNPATKTATGVFSGNAPGNKPLQNGTFSLTFQPPEAVNFQGTLQGSMTGSVSGQITITVTITPPGGQDSTFVQTQTMSGQMTGTMSGTITAKVFLDGSLSGQGSGSFTGTFTGTANVGPMQQQAFTDTTSGQWIATVTGTVGDLKLEGTVTPVDANGNPIGQPGTFTANFTPSGTPNVLQMGGTQSGTDPIDQSFQQTAPDGTTVKGKVQGSMSFSQTFQVTITFTQQ